MAENKTRETDASVEAFLDAVPDERKREDAWQLVALMTEVTGEPPRMWGDSIVGFGRYHYKYASGREGDAPLAGFSPRKANLTIYVTLDQNGELLDRLGKFTTGKVCLYIKRLSDVDLAVLREMVTRCVAHTRAIYP
jgi:hypothetical protein